MPGSSKNVKQPIQTAPAQVHPPCPICRGPVARGDGEKPGRWMRRLCCSRDCRNRFLAARLTRIGEHAPCAHCGGPVTQRDGETRNWYMRRPTCSAECARAAAWLNAGRASQAAAERRRGWPQFTGSELRGQCFADHDIEAKDGGSFRALPEPAWVPSANALGGR